MVTSTLRSYAPKTIYSAYPPVVLCRKRAPEDTRASIASFPGPTQLSIAFPYCKRRKTGWGLGMRLGSACMGMKILCSVQPCVATCSYKLALAHMKNNDIKLKHTRICVQSFPNFTFYIGNRNLSLVPRPSHCPVFDQYLSDQKLHGQ